MCPVNVSCPALFIFTGSEGQNKVPQVVRGLLEESIGARAAGISSWNWFSFLFQPDMLRVAILDLFL